MGRVARWPGPHLRPPVPSAATAATMQPWLLLAAALLSAASARHPAPEPALAAPAAPAAEVGDELWCPRDNETARLSLPAAAGTYRYAVVVRRCKTFRGAQDVCRRCYRGQLASIHSYSRNVCLRRALRASTNRGQAWIGAVTRPRGRSVYCRWVDCSAWNYAHWLRGYPLLSGTFCTSLCSANGRWRSVRCRVKLPFICEY
ncbi:bone marrow proteoglycan [Struthio camelus]|uniref:bone marrow proteoglycan n=1 Tax=Struthio camelus TaxID=8801 RepID=UPI003603DE5D